MSEPKLRANAIGVPGAIAMSLGVIGPASGMIFTPAIVAGHAGAAVPLVYVISLIGVIFVVNTIVEFSRRLIHAGSFYGFNTAGLGSTFGFLSGWLLLAAYLYAQNLLAFGSFASAAVANHLGVHIGWWVFTIAAAVAIWALSWRGISSSMRTDLYLEAFGVLVVVAVVAAIFVKGGATGHVWQPKLFDPGANRHGWGGVFYGMIFGVATFAGFEAAATVGEETARPRKNIPRAIWGAVIGLGILFVVSTYGMSLGYGAAHASAFATATAPMDHLASVYGNHVLVFAVDIAGTVSALAVALAVHNAAVRVTFAMGRDGTLPRRLGNTHERLMTPTIAITLVSGLAVFLSLSVGLSTDPYPDGYAYFATFSTLPILAIYMITSVSLIRFIWVNDRQDFRFVRHGLCPLLGAAVMVLPIYGSISPWPAWPANLITVLAFAWIILGLVVGYRLRSRAGDMLERLGRLLASDPSTTAGPGLLVERRDDLP
ncbi:MAG: APC family permease [Solirubrobacterales bacterium]|nr:APC family permease [Solirubrobacterales bacterium]